MKVGDLVQFNETDFLGTIIKAGAHGTPYPRAVIWIHGDVNFKNPTHMSMDTLKRTSEIISEGR